VRDDQTRQYFLRATAAKSGVQLADRIEIELTACAMAGGGKVSWQKKLSCGRRSSLGGAHHAGG